MPVRAGKDSITINIDAVAGDQRAQDLGYRLANSCVIEVHDTIPAACHADIRIIWHKLSAKHTVLVAVDPQTIAVHRSNQLPGQLVVEVNLEILSCGDKLKTVAGEVTGEESIILMPHRVLELARSHIPMVDDSVTCHAQKSLLSVLLTEFVLHLDVLA